MTVKTTAPKIEDRTARDYVGIRVQTPMDKMPDIIPQLIDECADWLTNKGITPKDAPFMRYYVIDMEKELDVEIGWFVDEKLSGDDRVNVVTLPAGKYAALVYTDVTQGIEGNKVLIEWAKENGIEWDAWDSDRGHAFASRIEIFLDGPEDDPDPTTWRTEVAIKVAD